MVGYSELLRKKGEDASPGYFGNLQRETKYLLKKFRISRPKKGEDLIEKCDKVVVVDNVNPIGLSEKIDLEKVVEVIDHHYSEKRLLKEYPNAKGEIEEVGAAATLIVEKYMESEIPIDRDPAILLYSGIISNTLNFQSNTTTERDKKAAKWLRKLIDIPKTFARDMFASKSDLSDKKIYDVLTGDLKELKDDSLYIAQLEIIDLEKTVREGKEEITKALKTIKKEKSGKYVFLTGMDLEKGFNLFLVVDDKSKELLEKALNVKFVNNIARREGLIMRKEIIPIIEKYL